METKFTESDIQRSLRDITQNLKDNTETYIKEKRSSFQHFTLLTATLLGFSSGVAAISGFVNCAFKVSWIIQVLTISVGVFLLILESETRYYRGFLAISSVIRILNDIKSKKGIFDKKSISSIMIEALKELSGFSVKSKKTLKERMFDWFTRNIKGVEIVFLYFIFSFGYFFSCRFFDCLKCPL